MLSTRVDICKDIYLQRQGKCLQDAYHTFFCPEVMPLYQGLTYYYDVNQLSKTYLNSTEEEQQFAVSCGQIVLVSIYLSRFLGISLKHPVIYNSNKSSIIHLTPKETQTLPLYIYTRSSDYRTMDLALKLLG